MKKRIGILAEKLNHSLSPIIHNHWDKKYKTNFTYKKYEVKKDQLDKFFSDYRRNNIISGFNITIPYK